MSVFNMTQVTPKVIDPTGKLQDKLAQHWIGCPGLEYEAPHVTIRSQDNKKARLLFSTGGLMEASEVDADIIKIVQADMMNVLLH